MTDVSDANPVDASIADLFPADRIEARFVLAMSMARDDLDRALRDGIKAAALDDQDFTYRVRLVTSHLVEALDSLNAYSQDGDVKKLISRVPKEHRKHLARARSVAQKVGDKALDTVRNNTFHYPSPKTNYNPTSDAQLRDVLIDIGPSKAYMHLDHRGEHPVVTLTFAQEVALALAIAGHSADTEAARTQYETTSDGAVAFTKWAEALLLAYFTATGAEIGQPRILEDKNAET
ncbi:hypothetical protein [Conexibacter woesei]|uniref:hypothetical protein n=1 Tax=Conexibacter woesei TaxID=191495 RepID=UPI0004239F5B|nr:hypothetical protein [Conexibacter woesei]